MLGPPGAGKGTQSERFARTHGLPKIATGDILRDAVKAGTAMGRAAGAGVDAGELVSGGVVVGVGGGRLLRPRTGLGVGVDGVSRTVAQGDAPGALMTC